MIADRIKLLREQAGMTQAGLAKLLGITRSSVNAWEMGLSVPSTQYLMELAEVFRVSTDYLLGLESSSAVSIAGLTDQDAALVHALVEHLRNKNQQQSC